MSQIDRLDAQGGFTLMEILVAMMILAFSLTVVLQLFSGGLRSGNLSRNYLRSVYVAKQKMEEMLLVEALVPGDYHGEVADGVSWHTTVEQIEMEEEERGRPGLVLFTVTVACSWQEGRHVKDFSIKTVRLGPAIGEEEGAP